MVEDGQFLEMKNNSKSKVKKISGSRKSTPKSENKKKSVKGKNEDKQSLTYQTKDEDENVLKKDNECKGEANTFLLKQWIDLVNDEEGLKHIKKEWKNNVNGFQHQKIAEIIYRRNLGVNEIFKTEDDKVKEVPSVTRRVIYEDELKSEDFYLKHLIEDDIYDHETLNVDIKFIRDIHWAVSTIRNPSKENLIKDDNFKKNRSSKPDLTRTDNIFERKHLEEYNTTEVDIEKCERHKAPKGPANLSKYVQHKHKCRNLLGKPNINLPVMKFKEALLKKTRQTHSHKKKDSVERTMEMLKNVKFRKNNLNLSSCEKKLCTNYQIKPHFNLSDVDILKKHINNVINRRKYPKFKLNNGKDHEINYFSDLKSREKDSVRNKKDISLLEKENPTGKAISYEKREQLNKLNYGITSLSRLQKEQNEWDELIQKRMKGNPAWKSLSGKLESLCNSVLYKPSSYEIKQQMKLWDEREIMDEFWKKKLNNTNR